MSYLELYKKRMGIDMGDVLTIRENTTKATINRNFTKTHGYKRAHILDVVANTNTDIDIVVTSGTSQLEKTINLRPDTKLPIGIYVSYDDKTYIVREVDYDQLTPHASGFFCNQAINLKGVSVTIPCYTNSTTYGSKGIIDQSKFYELDSKTKIYLQKNIYTKAIKIGQRIMFDNQYLYKITEKDDLVFKGMYILVAQRDEAMPMDDFENNLAWNEYEADVPIPTEDVTPTIIGAEKVKLGEVAIYEATTENPQWSIDDESIARIIKVSGKTVTIECLKRGWFTLTCNGSLLDVMVC